MGRGSKKQRFAHEDALTISQAQTFVKEFDTKKDFV